MARKKAIELQDYTALDAYAIGLNEFYKSLRRAGFTVDLCLAIIIEPSAYPDWILPKMPNDLEPKPYEDEED
jgi:hypothetical protein